MFTRQAPPLLQAMYVSGMSPMSAAAMQGLLGQCQQALRHQGPIRFDYTRPEMKLTPPGGQGQNYPEPQDFPPEPDKEDGKEEEGVRPGGEMPPEHLPDDPPQPIGPGEVPAFPGQPTVPTDKYFPGRYLFIDRDLRQIGLRCEDSRRHPVYPINLNAANTIHSVVYEGVKTEFADIKITEQATKTLFAVDLTPTQVDLLTGADIVSDGFGGWTLSFSKIQAYVFKPEPLSPDVIALDAIDYLKDASLEPGGLTFTAERAFAFKPESLDDVVIATDECPEGEGEPEGGG